MGLCKFCHSPTDFHYGAHELDGSHYWVCKPCWDYIRDADEGDSDTDSDSDMPELLDPP